VALGEGLAHELGLPHHRSELAGRGLGAARRGAAGTAAWTGSVALVVHPLLLIVQNRVGLSAPPRQAGDIGVLTLRRRAPLECDMVSQAPCRRILSSPVRRSPS